MRISVAPATVPSENVTVSKSMKPPSCTNCSFETVVPVGLKLKVCGVTLGNPAARVPLTVRAQAIGTSAADWAVMTSQPK